jgi:hypothetical protein
MRRLGADGLAHGWHGSCARRAPSGLLSRATAKRENTSMPQATLDRVTQRPRMRAGRAKTTATTKVRSLMGSLAGLARRRTGAGSARTTGVPRGWWAGATTRAWTQTRTLVRWVPLALAGMRIVTRLRQRPRRALRTRGRAATNRLPGRFAFVAGRSIGRVEGAVGTARLAPQAVKVARKAGFGWRPFGRPAPQGVVQSTTWRLRRGWRRARSFTLGFALGTIWAYLFAPRLGVGYQAVRQSDQQKRPA